MSIKKLKKQYRAGLKAIYSKMSTRELILFSGHPEYHYEELMVIGGILASRHPNDYEFEALVEEINRNQAVVKEMSDLSVTLPAA